NGLTAASPVSLWRDAFRRGTPVRRTYSRKHGFAGEKALDRLARSDHVVLGTVHHDFRGTWPGVVLTRHGKRIGAGRHDGQPVALLQVQAAVARQPVAALTYGTNNIV